MAYDEELAQQIRVALGARKGVTETKMFGGIAFMINGNMACGVMKDEMLVRVPQEEADALSKSPGAHRFAMMARRPPAKGFILVGGSGIDSKTKVQKWVARGADFAITLPTKAAKSTKKKPVKPKKR